MDLGSRNSDALPWKNYFIVDAANTGLHVQEKFLAFLTAPAGSSQQMLEARQSEFPSWGDYLASPAKDRQLPEEADPDASFVSMEA